MKNEKKNTKNVRELEKGEERTNEGLIRKKCFLLRLRINEILRNKRNEK